MGPSAGREGGDSNSAVERGSVCRAGLPSRSVTGAAGLAVGSRGVRARGARAGRPDRGWRHRVAPAANQGRGLAGVRRVRAPGHGQPRRNIPSSVSAANADVATTRSFAGTVEAKSPDVDRAMYRNVNHAAFHKPPSKMSARRSERGSVRGGALMRVVSGGSGAGARSRYGCCSAATLATVPRTAKHGAIDRGWGGRALDHQGLLFLRGGRYFLSIEAMTT